MTHDERARRRLEREFAREEERRGAEESLERALRAIVKMFAEGKLVYRETVARGRRVAGAVDRLKASRAVRS